MNLADLVSLDRISEVVMTEDPGSLLAKMNKHGDYLRVKLSVLVGLFKDKTEMAEHALGEHCLQAIKAYKDDQGQTPYASAMKKRSQFSNNRDNNTFCLFVPWDKSDVTAEKVQHILSCIPVPRGKRKFSSLVGEVEQREEQGEGSMAAHIHAVVDTVSGVSRTSLDAANKDRQEAEAIHEQRQSTGGTTLGGIKASDHGAPASTSQLPLKVDALPAAFTKHFQVPSFVLEWYLARFGPAFVDKAATFVGDWYTQSDTKLEDMQGRLGGYISYKDMDERVLKDLATTFFMVSKWPQRGFPDEVVEDVFSTYQAMLNAGWSQDQVIAKESFDSNDAALKWVKQKFMDGDNFVVVKEGCQRDPSTFIMSLLGTKVKPDFVKISEGGDKCRAQIHTYDMIWLGSVLEVIINKLFQPYIERRKPTPHPHSSAVHYALWHAAVRWNWPKKPAREYKTCRVAYAHDVYPLGAAKEETSTSTGIEQAYECMGLIKSESNCKFLSRLYPPAPAATGPYFISDEVPAINLHKARQWVEGGGPVDSSVLLLMDDLIGAEIRESYRSDVELGIGLTLPVGVWSTLYTTTQYHVEDMGLSALNVLYDGAIKLWLVAPTEHVADNFYKEVGDRTKDILRKRFAPQDISMDTLIKCGFKPILQYPGDIVISRAGCSSIHVTMSSGASFAMAVNCLYLTGGALHDHMVGTKEWLKEHGVSLDGPQGKKPCNHYAVMIHLEDTFPSSFNHESEEQHQESK